MKIEVVGQKVWFKENEQTWCYDLIDLSSEGQRRKKTNSASPDLLVAQMPGKITKIFVQEGQSVEVGQALIVMEAMKMEYTMKSELQTTVEKIFVELGQQMTVGASLIQLKKV